MIDCAVILAVGNPTHKSQLVYNRAHAMLPALGKPLVVRIMNPLHRAGIRQFVVVVGVNEGAVASYLNSQWVPNAQVDFVLKPNNVSIPKVLSEIARRHQQPFLLAGYNTITHSHFPVSLLTKYQEYPDSLFLGGAANTLSQSKRHFYAVTEGQVVEEIVQEPPSAGQALTLMDMAVCGGEFVQYLAEMIAETGQFYYQFMDIAAMYRQAGGATHITQTAWTLQIETDRDLLTLNKLLLEDKQDAHTLSELPSSVQVVPPVRIDPQVSVGAGARIGPYVYLERGCNIGSDAVVEHAIILQRVTIAPRATVKDMIVSTRGQIG